MSQLQHLVRLECRRLLQSLRSQWHKLNLRRPFMPVLDQLLRGLNQSGQLTEWSVGIDRDHLVVALGSYLHGEPLACLAESARSAQST